MSNVFGILYRLSLVMSLAVGTIVFLVDLRVPRGLTVHALYVLPLLISVLADDRRLTLGLAALFTILIVLGYVLSPLDGVPNWIVVWDRVITVLVVWITAVLGAEMSSAKRQIRNMGKLLVMCAWTKQVKVEGNWVPIDQSDRAPRREVESRDLQGSGRESVQGGRPGDALTSSSLSRMSINELRNRSILPAQENAGPQTGMFARGVQSSA